MATMPFQKYLGLGWIEVDTVAELRRVEATHRHTYVLYTFPTRLASANPEIWERLQSAYRTVDTRSGSISGGAIVIKKRE